MEQVSRQPAVDEQLNSEEIEPRRALDWYLLMGRKAGTNVVVHPEGWAVRRDNASRASKVFDTQREAIDYGRNIAREAQAELRIQGRDGKWRDSDSYGNDPNPPKDTKN